MNNDKVKLLSKPFPFEEVEAKVQVTSKDTSKGLRGMVVFYLDSRTIQKRLDDVLGHLNWKNQYSVWHDFEANDTKKMQKSQICGIAIYNDERNEWVGKFDGAECSNIEPIKGGLTDSFKRAACMWGIGRYLYELDGIWVDVEQRGNTSFIKDNQKPLLKNAYEAAVKKIIDTGIKQGANQQNSGGNAAGAKSAATNNQPANNQANQQRPTATAQQKQNNNPPPAAQQSANAEQQPPVPQTPGSEQKPQGNVLPMHDFKIHSMKPAGKESQLLELCSPDGEITSAYVRTNEQGIAIGVHLRNVQLEERSNSYGNYNLLTGYEIAAAA
jgi:hypothetical protein